MADKPVAKPPAAAVPPKAATSAPAPSTKPAAKPAAEPPKPVHVGGESFADRILPHIKKILIGTVVLVVVVGIFAGVTAIKEGRQERDSAKLDRVLAIAQQRIRGKDEKPDPNVPSFADPKERAATILDTIAKQDTDAPGPAFRGGLLLDAGKIDEAISVYRSATSGKTLEAVLCREGLGLALEAKAAAEKDIAARQKGYEEALTAFVTMQPDENGVRHVYALYHQARLQLLLGKRDQAKALFEKAQELNKGADREIADLIEKRLASLGAS
jgi:tetratricopeptide (TPR) repeat protein